MNIKFLVAAAAGIISHVAASSAELPCQNTQLSLPTGIMNAHLHSLTGLQYGGAPEPTAAPNVPFAELVKRQSLATTVCGLLSTATTWSYNCSSGWFCNTNTQDRNAFGCCTAGQCWQPTTCLDYTASKGASNCASTDRACIFSTIYCTNPARPYCGKFVNGVVSALDCFSSPGLTYKLVPYTGNANVITISSTTAGNTTSTRSSSTITSFSSTTTTPSLSADSVPFTQQQQSVDNITPLPRTSSGLAAGLGQTGEYFYGLVMSVVFLFV